ncbi:MAG: peptidoglycan DD-metalloendopeptidase family protein, partial [Gammaproteobacteria bacterium]|nr:peptidoglycan DD-metalloendopeptidase family protein [Gammaproteobacteria bacterium]
LNEEALSQIHASLSVKNTDLHSIPVQVKESTQIEPETPLPQHVQPDLKQTIVKIKPGHSLSAIFKRYRFSHQDLYSIMQKGPEAKILRNLKPGNTLIFTSDNRGQLQSLTYQISRLQSVIVNRVNNSFTLETVEKQLEKRVNYSQGQIKNSLFEAGKKAGLSDALVMEMAGIFGWDIDFALDIRQGDEFSVLYEEQFIDGKKYQTGNILAAEFTNQGKTFKAIRFTDKSGRTSYYTPEGLSMRKTFLRSPVDFRRISSRFGKRKHPILKKRRLHKGVDYAARRGTPIQSSGDGKVIFKGRKGGYGRVVIIQHGSRYQTLYAHMNGFKRGIRVGKYVKQGQTIGFVGSSGRATGPHLHYEFRVNGTHRNPLTVKLPSSAPIKSAYKGEFIAYADRVLSQLNTYKPTQIALNEE